MRQLGLKLWVIVMCVGLFTNNVAAFFLEGNISFHIDPNPSADLYFPVYPLMEASAFELTGHALMFAAFTFLLYKNISRLTLTFGISILYAIITELLQPFFGRGADWYDLGADFVGICSVLSFLFIEKTIARLPRNTSRNH
ncbi:VanZ family protein [Cytobacillus gottheilii]|uniref:VanZ family protein n=1 Tax=Cytobacillus gottheilii TaxID=859144 RepID=UPI003CD0C4C9